MISIRFGARAVAPALLASLLVGGAAGVGTYTFVYAKGASYLSNNPDTCGNCHIMQEHLSAWRRGSHSAAATCNDCHTPPGAVAKYMNKAVNGFRHSLGFTTGDFPDPLFITDSNRAVTEAACRNCHEKALVAVAPSGAAAAGSGDISCISCHSRVGHWTR